jgi:hypothetical protein
MPSQGDVATVLRSRAGKQVRSMTTYSSVRYCEGTGEPHVLAAGNVFGSRAAPGQGQYRFDVFLLTVKTTGVMPTYRSETWRLT